MCGKFSFQPSPEMLSALSTELHDAFTRGTCIVPSMPILLYRAEGMDVAQWNLKPSWADNTFKATTHNARSETIAEKPVFRDAWAHSRRCIIPANSFFEWNEQKDGYEVTPQHSDYLYFAGLWEDNQHGLSATIITKAAQDRLRAVHPRMPVMLSRKQLPFWIKGTHNDALALIQGANTDNLSLTEIEKPQKAQSSLL